MDLEVMVFSPLAISGKISACENTVVSTMLTGSTVSDLSRSSEGSSAIPRLASSVSNGGGKNSVRCLRNGSPNLLRSQDSPHSGSSLRRHAGVPGDPDPAGPVQTVREGEAGIAYVPLRQSLLHEAVLLLRRPAMPRLQHPGCRQRSVSGLAHGQGAGEAVHAGAAPACRYPGSEDHRDRRSVDPQGPHLPDRGVGLYPGTGHLFPRNGPVRSLHGRLLQVAGTQEEPGDQDRRDGHVEALLEVHEEERARPPSGGSLRQVSRDTAPGGGPRQGSPVRIPPALGEGQSVRQGAAVHAALPVGEPLPSEI